MKGQVIISLHGRCTFPGNPLPKVTRIEERVPLADILTVPTLADAIEVVLKHTDVVAAIDTVTSFKIDGHEIIGTFIDADDIAAGAKKRKKDAEGMTRLLRKSLDVLAEAQAQRGNGQVIGDDVIGMLENTVAKFRSTLDEWSHRRN